MDNSLSYLVLKEYFEQIWKEYPRQENKEKAYLAYCKVMDNRDVTHDEMLEQVKRYAYKMLKEPKYTLTLEKWIEGKRWQDTLAPAPRNDDIGKAVNFIVMLASGYYDPQKIIWLERLSKTKHAEILEAIKTNGTKEYYKKWLKQKGIYG